MRPLAGALKIAQGHEALSQKIEDNSEVPKGQGLSFVIAERLLNRESLEEGTEGRTRASESVKGLRRVGQGRRHLGIRPDLLPLLQGGPEVPQGFIVLSQSPVDNPEIVESGCLGHGIAGPGRQGESLLSHLQGLPHLALLLVEHRGGIEEEDAVQRRPGHGQSLPVRLQCRGRRAKVPEDRAFPAEDDDLLSSVSDGLEEVERAAIVNESLTLIPCAAFAPQRIGL